MLSSETKDGNMEFKIDDYDLQVEGTCGEFQWMFNNGNLWVYKDWEDTEHKYRIETEIQIEPFSSEKEIERVVRGTVRNCTIPLPEHRLSWKVSMKKKEEPTVMSILWSAKLMEECQESCLFGVISAKNQ